MSVDSNGFVHDSSGMSTGEQIVNGADGASIINHRTGEIIINNGGSLSDSDGPVGHIEKS